MFSCHREGIINDAHWPPAHTFPSTGISISNEDRNLLYVDRDVDANLRPVVLSCLCIVYIPERCSIIELGAAPLGRPNRRDKRSGTVHAFNSLTDESQRGRLRA